MHLRLGGHGLCREHGHPVRAGGLRHARLHQAPAAPHRRGDRAGRRGCEDPVRLRQHGGAHERQLRGRHRRLHRPDGHAFAADPLRDERSCRAPDQNLLHRLALRRVRQVRHPAAAQPGRTQGGRLRLHLRRRGQPDHRGSCAGARNRGQHRVSRRPADLLLRAAQGVRPGLEHTGAAAGKLALFRGDGRGLSGERAAL